MSADHPPAPRRGVAPVAAPDAAAVGSAVRATLIYSDLFDYPLRAHEAHRYLVAPAPLWAVSEALDREVTSG
ncbi:MAG: hypothetical protein NTZ05_00400, partial [Chloroflexi bacterium]|nr:hypothetical protein [Chloroflexota bacterium]